MFSNPSRRRTQGAVALFGGLVASSLIGACDDPAALTDTRPEGPPEVLAVLVNTDPAFGLIESATYCKPNDEKRPGLVGLPDFTTQVVCPEDGTAASEVTDAAPDGWYVRIMFDELIDPDIEDLIPVLDEDGNETGTFEGSLANTQPVTLECQGVDDMFHPVPYDGYYSPSGNAVTWPVGPSLVVKPDFSQVIVPTNRQCRISIKPGTVVDKSGIALPDGDLGPYTFRTAPIQVLAIDPHDSGDPADPTTVDAYTIYYDNIYIQFNTSNVAIDDSGLQFTPDPGFCSVSGDPCTTNADCGSAGGVCEGAGAYSYSGTVFGLSESEYFAGPVGFLKTDDTYTFEISEGTMVADKCGVVTTFGPASPDTNTKFTFKTNPFDLNSIVPGPGDVIAPNRKVRLNFNNNLDLGSIATTEYSFTPALSSPTIATSDPAFGGGDILFGGHYQPDTSYTFTLNAGATITDVYGAVYTSTEAQTVMFKTAPIALTGASPTNGSTVTKATPTSTSTISLSFNQSMDLSTLEAADYTISPAVTLTPSASGCSAASVSCSLRLTGVFAPGDYTFTLKQGAVIEDALGNMYTQASDRVIEFTVEEAGTPPAATPCLGQ